ncbi:DNA-binding protein [Massariosphaeria phaeospora]|uniref:DNA-binding protein n=1 Tax=Massariosphaeria phaeospora TaxID=100035 RepID=A0A7C8M693_9PLEO|nr:DNA-binding protein [Massariosphaeria phaeospora]
MAPTYLDTLAAFTSFLTAYTHTLLYLRALYPRSSFAHSRFHNTSVHQSRHPLVCDWIRDAIAAVREELLAGTVSRIGIVIFWLGDGSSSHGHTDGGGAGSPQIMERYMLDVSAFPVVEKGERNMEIEWDDAASADGHDGGAADGRRKGKEPALDADVDVNLSEQFRAAFITLTTRSSQLAPLPANCSFNISMELKDEADVDPPIGHPQPWIPVQPSLQKTGRKGGIQANQDAAKRGDKIREGQDLGGVRVTPMRTVEVGVFRFETWVEEGKAKFELDQTSKGSFASSGG